MGCSTFSEYTVVADISCAKVSASLFAFWFCKSRLTVAKTHSQRWGESLSRRVERRGT